MIKDAEIEAFYGMRRHGKSTGAKAIIMKLPRVVVFDVVNEYHRLRGFRKANSLNQVKELMIEGGGDKYKIAYQPTIDDTPLALHQLCSLLFITQMPYFEERSNKEITLVVEELYEGAPSSALPNNQLGFKRAVLKGGHYGINIIGITQRPKTVAPYFRDNASINNIYRLGCPTSINFLESKIAKESRGIIANLKKHEFLRIDDLGVKKLKNKLS